MRSQETWARRLLSCRCRTVALLPLPFGDEDTRIRPRALRLAHPFATLSLFPGALTSRWSSTARFRAGPQSSRTRVGPFAGDERCVHHRSRVFVTRSPVGRRALASSSREPPLREPSASCVLVIERCVRPTSAHPRILKRAPIVSCGDRVSSAHSGGVSCDTTSSSRSRDRCGRRFHDAVRALVARVRGRPGVLFPCSARSCAPPLTPLSPSPEPRVAISREIKLRVRPRPFRFRTS